MMMKEKILFLLMLLVPSILLAQWQPTNGPEGGTVNDIMKKGNFVFSCTGEFGGGGVYRSSDNGQSWKIISNGFEPTNKVNSLSANQDYIFAGIRLSGVFRSSDNGETWEEKNNGLIGDEKTTTAVLANSDTIIEGTQYLGVFRSNDNGENWFNFNTGLSGLGKRIKEIVLHQNKYFIATDSGVYRYSENLASWEAVNSGIPTNYCQTIISRDTNLFVGTLDGIYRSTNNGESWSFAGNGLPSGTTYALASNNDAIYAGIDEIVYKSTNAGNNWIALSNGLPGEYNLIYSLYADSNLLLAGYRALGIFKSSNGGDEWFLSSKGIANVSVYDLESKENRLFAVTEDADYGLIFRTDNNGEKWHLSNEGATIIGYKAFYNDGDYLWAGSFGDGLYRSSDDGNNWEKISISIFFPSYISALTGNDSAVFIGTEGFGIDVYKTTDNGNSFEELNVPGSGDITALHSTSEYLYAGRTTGVYRTSDNGNTWVAVNSVFPANVFIQDIDGKGSFIYVSTLNSGLFRSSNNGNDWEEIGSGIIDDVVYSIETINEKIFAGTKENGVFYSEDNGATWMELNKGFFVGFSGTYSSVLSMTIKSDTVYCGLQNYGVWKLPVPIMTYSTSDQVLPKRYSLSQNYPNPFNPTTSIEYSIPESGNVKLKVYNSIGKEVATLSSGYKATGVYKVNFDAAGLSSGIYYYKLTSGNFSEVKKMILLK
jgi:photosystem II stability/assembly factor-like uncharacterized protein